MGSCAWNGAVLLAIGALWLASGTQREKPVVVTPAANTDAVRSLEVKVATSPGDVNARRDLAQAYLDAHAPGLAVRVVESAPPDARQTPVLEHVYARALVDEGRSADALAAERRVLAACDPDDPRHVPCDAWVIASAQRREQVLAELVALGVEDAQAHPEASALAYQNATREARLAIR